MDYDITENNGGSDGCMLMEGKIYVYVYPLFCLSNKKTHLPFASIPRFSDGLLNSGLRGEGAIFLHFKEKVNGFGL